VCRIGFLIRPKTKPRSSEERPGFHRTTFRQVFWLSDRPTSCPFPSSDPSTNSGPRKVVLTSFVPDYSGVAVPDSHGVPFSALSHLNTDQFTQFHTTIREGMSNSLKPRRSLITCLLARPIATTGQTILRWGSPPWPPKGSLAEENFFG
jgi:hypothetical protein